MQDYHVYAHYVQEDATSKTSPKHKTEPQRRVSPIKESMKEEISNTSMKLSPMKIAATTLVVGAKINGYVGELTENRVAQRRTQIGFTIAGMGLLAINNPLTAAIGAAVYFGDKAIEYNIKQYKENLSAAYLKQLSGGTVSTGR